MEVRTFTNFWNMEKKLYSIYDVALPVPISLKVLGAFILAAVPWGGLMLLFHIPFGNPSYMIWLGPPIAFGYLASRPIFQRKSLTEYLKSMMRYYLQPKQLSGLRPLTYDTQGKYRVLIRVFNTPSKKDQ